MSTSYLFQRIKLPTSTNFYGGTAICSKVITISLLEAWYLVPQSKNSTRGHFSACVHILSFSAYQTAYLHQVSCWYHILHNYCNNLPHYSLVRPFHIQFFGSHSANDLSILIMQFYLKYQVQISPTTITYIGLTSNVKPALVFVCKTVSFLYLAFCI